MPWPRPMSAPVSVYHTPLPKPFHASRTAGVGQVSAPITAPTYRLQFPSFEPGTEIFFKGSLCLKLQEFVKAGYANAPLFILGSTSTGWHSLLMPGGFSYTVNGWLQAFCRTVLPKPPVQRTAGIENLAGGCPPGYTLMQTPQGPQCVMALVTSFPTPIPLAPPSFPKPLHTTMLFPHVSPFLQGSLDWPCPPGTKPVYWNGKMYCAYG